MILIPVAVLLIQSWMSNQTIQPRSWASIKMNSKTNLINTTLMKPAMVTMICVKKSKIAIKRTKKTWPKTINKGGGMRAVTWQAKRKVSVEDVPDPVIQEPTDIIIKVTSTCICGSDLHLYEVMAPFMEKGDIMGHEPM